MKDEGLYIPEILKVTCTGICGGNILLEFDNGDIFTFFTDEPDYFQIGKEYDFKDNVTHNVIK